MEYNEYNLDPYSRPKPMIRDLMCPLLHNRNNITDFFDIRMNRFIRIPIKDNNALYVDNCIKEFNKLSTEIQIQFKRCNGTTIKNFYYKNDNINILATTPFRVIKVAEIDDSVYDENVIEGKNIYHSDDEYYLDIFFSDNFLNHKYVKHHGHQYFYNKIQSYLLSFDFDMYIMYEYNIISYYEEIPQNIEKFHYTPVKCSNNYKGNTFLPVIIVCSDYNHTVILDNENITTDLLVYVLNDITTFNDIKLHKLELYSCLQECTFNIIPICTCV